MTENLSFENKSSNQFTKKDGRLIYTWAPKTTENFCEEIYAIFYEYVCAYRVLQSNFDVTIICNWCIREMMMPQVYDYSFFNIRNIMRPFRETIRFVRKETYVIISLVFYLVCTIFYLF